MYFLAEQKRLNDSFSVACVRPADVTDLIKIDSKTILFIFKLSYCLYYSLVRLALSSNFPGGLLSAAQSYPSLAPNAQNALTLSLTSTSSESEQVCVVFKFLIIA